MLSYQVILPAMGYTTGLFMDYVHRYFSAGAQPLPHGYSGALHFPSLGEAWARVVEGSGYLWQAMGLPFFFLPLFSPLVMVLGLPSFFIIVLQKEMVRIGCGHLLAPLLPCLAVAAVFGLSRCLEFFRHPGREWARKPFLTFVFSVVFLSNFGYTRYGAVLEAENIFDHRFVGVRNVFHPVFYRQDDQDRIAWKLISAIPERASVCASGDLLPQLSHRNTLYEVKSDDDNRLRADQQARRDGSVCREVEYMLLRTRSVENGSSMNDFNNFESAQIAEGFVREGVFEYAAREGDFILLRRKKGTGDGS